MQPFGIACTEAPHLTPPASRQKPSDQTDRGNHKRKGTSGVTQSKLKPVISRQQHVLSDRLVHYRTREEGEGDAHISLKGAVRMHPP